MNKNEARKKGLSARDALSPETREYKSKKIYQRLIPYINKHHTISCYISMRTEVNTYPILQYCLDQHKELCVPIIRNRRLLFMTIDSLDHLHDAPFHTKEPDNGAIIEPENIDLMIVPLSSFDEQNNRTGYGKGYYDTILDKVPLKIGIAFQEQKVDSIEADEKDIVLDSVIYA